MQRSFLHRLALGTAQFGFDYGVTNPAGQVPLAEVKEILKLCTELEIKTLDTARVYGSSEMALGQCPLESFDVVTKFSLGGIHQNVENLKISFETSLKNLKVDSVYALLAHNFDELKTNAKPILAAVESLKTQGKIKKFGVSLYHPEQVPLLLQIFDPDLVQIPMNLFDQRFLNSGRLEELSSKNVEVHVRSAFLQGILLQNERTLDPFFDFCRDDFGKLRATLANAGLTQMQGCLKFLLELKSVSKVVLGVCSSVQLKEIADSLHAIRHSPKIDFSKFQSDDARLINPLSWPMLKGGS